MLFFTQIQKKVSLVCLLSLAMLALAPVSSQAVEIIETTCPQAGGNVYVTPSNGTTTSIPCPQGVDQGQAFYALWDAENNRFTNRSAFSTIPDLFLQIITNRISLVVFGIVFLIGLWLFTQGSRQKGIMLMVIAVVLWAFQEELFLALAGFSVTDQELDLLLQMAQPAPYRQSNP